MKISAAGNTEAPSYGCLLEKGYNVIVVDSVCGKSIVIARRGDIELVGNSMLELLGLAALADFKGDDWQASDKLLDDYLSKISG